MKLDVFNADGIIRGTFSYTLEVYDADGLLKMSIKANRIRVDTVGTPDYTTAQQVIDIALSAGWISGGGITDNGDGSIDVAAGVGFIRSSNSPTAPLYPFSWDASTNVALGDGDSTYVYVDYNSGSPQIATTTTSADVRDNEHDKFELAEIVRESTTLHITDHRQIAGDAIGLIQRRMYDILKIERATAYGGLIIGELGTRNVSVSGGRIWVKLVPVTIDTIDTSDTDTFDRYYQDGLGGWTKQTGQTQWDNTHYDDGSGVLATMAAARYASQYFYIDADGSLVSVFGQAQYTTEAAAEAETAPVTLPPRISEHALLIGRIVFQKNDSSATAVQSAFTNTFAIVGSSGVTDHGALTGLADDDHSQYLLVDGTRAMTGTLDTDGNGITMVNTVTEFSDDNTLGGNSDSAVPTEKAVKGYVDNNAPQNYRTGLTLRKLSASQIVVSQGTAVAYNASGTRLVVNIGLSTVLDLATAALWVTGSTAETASAWIHVYMNSAGALRLHNHLPNEPFFSSTAPPWVTAQVNQAGWNGTAGNGLNATTVVYDDGAGGDPTDETIGILAGRYALFYTDSGLTTGRGRGSGAAGSIQNLSIAQITAVNTGTNTITLEAGHNIAINDNDYIYIVDASPPLYRTVSSTSWRWIGALYNDSGSDLTEYTDNLAISLINEGSDYTTSSTTPVAIDSTDLARPIIVTDRPLETHFTSLVSLGAAAASVGLTLFIDGIDVFGDDGETGMRHAFSGTAFIPIHVHHKKNYLPGTHTVSCYWSTDGGTATMYAGAGTADGDVHPYLSVQS